MSVNMHLPSSASYRGQPYGHHPRAPRAAAKTEDAQPNELLSRRNISGPPVVRPSAPLPRFRGRSAGRGTKPYVNTKRHVPPLPGFKSMRTDAHGNRDMTPLSATHSESQSGPHRQGSRRRDSDATRGDARSGASSSNPKDKLTIWTPMPQICVHSLQRGADPDFAVSLARSAYSGRRKALFLQQGPEMVLRQIITANPRPELGRDAI
ncbi:hypothetical protein BD414DRAFT_508036 [Trametes punicea]|nr:hypothetical protein BD414DRAFT_508036 [Trametes punicea]